MIDPYSLIPIITGVVSATVQISLAIHRWWKTKRDQRVQYEAFQSSQPTSDAAKELQSLMDVQAAFWRSNPGMWQALGKEAAKFVKSAYSKSNGYVSQLAQFAANMPDRMDWTGSAAGIKGVSSQLREMFAIHLGRVIAKMACRSTFSMFIPKETKEALAAQNARLLLEAQSNIGLLSGQIAAGEEGTRRQIEWYEKQQQLQQQPQSQQQYQAHPYQQPQPSQSSQYQPPQYQPPQYQPPQYQPPQQYEQQQARQGQQYVYPQQLGYAHWVQDRHHQQQYEPTSIATATANGTAATKGESSSECIIA